jgi:hypothetical protein
MDVGTAHIPLTAARKCRIHAIRQEVDPKQTFPSTGWQAYLQNPVQDDRSADNFVEGGSWNTDQGYSNARLDLSMPTLPLSETRTFNLALARGSGGKPVTQHLVAVDYCATCDDPPGMTLKYRQIRWLAFAGYQAAFQRASLFICALILRLHYRINLVAN